MIKFVEYISFLWKDRIILLLIAVFLLLELAAYLLWRYQVSPLSNLVFRSVSIEPNVFFSIAGLVNFLLGIISHKKEKEISYLFLIANCFLFLLFFILTIYYIFKFNQ